MCLTRRQQHHDTCSQPLLYIYCKHLTGYRRCEAFQGADVPLGIWKGEADTTRVDNGTLVLESYDDEEVLRPNLAFAPGHWSAFYLMHLYGGYALSVEGWPEPEKEEENLLST